MMRTYIVFAIALLMTSYVHAQCTTHPVTLTHQSDVAFPLPKECMSAIHDQAGRPYLYVAGKERGLVIYNVSNIAAPFIVDSIKVNDLDTMELMSVWQDGNYLYLALGNTFVNNSKPGMAIVDVSNPATPVLKSVWKYPVQSGGAGIVKTEGNYAYLGAMRRGLMILDITNKSSPVLKSVFKPSISYPNPTSPDSLKYNARGMAVNHDIVYLCDDAGGIRVINATNKSLPVETGRYSNPAVYSRPRAYNNLILDDTLLYVAVDYCGMEVLSIADTSNIVRVGWWNPWHCESPSNTWFNCPGHTNEIQYDPVCKTVFMASGKSEVNVLNVANPASPDSCTKYTTPGGNVGVWGLALWQEQLYACYIYVPLGIPFFSNWSGIKAITWNNCPTTGTVPPVKPTGLSIYPNPANGRFYISMPSQKNEQVNLTLYNLYGTKKTQLAATTDELEQTGIDIKGLAAGNYFIEVKSNSGIYYGRIVIGRN